MAIFRNGILQSSSRIRSRARLFARVAPLDSRSQYALGRIFVVRAFPTMVGRLTTVTVLLLHSASSAEAQIVAPAGRTLFNRAVMFRSFVRVDNFSEGASGESLRRIANPYAVVWGAYPNLSITFEAPLVSVRTRTPAVANPEFTTTSFADSAVFGRYDLWRKNVRGGYTRLSPEIGVSLPSGGAFSSNTANPIGALIFAHVRDPHWLIADAQFTYHANNDEGPRPGNRWNYDFAYLYRLFPRGGLGSQVIYVVLEVNGEHVRRTRLNGTPLADTGGNLVLLSPGIEFIPNRRLVVEFSSPIPVGRDLNGNQMRPSWSFLAGIRWLF